MKKKDPISMLGFTLNRPMCTYPDCKNKGRRIGKRKYSNRCEKHKPQYGAA